MPINNQEPFHPFDFFNGGVSPIDMFTQKCIELPKVYLDCVLGEEDGEVWEDGRPEVALIALMAYSEAFFLETFAAITNICPSTLISFSVKRPETNIPLKYAVSVADGKIRLGSLIAEQLDFGNSSKINAIFVDLINRQPFSRESAKIYNELLELRHQLVHHGGIKTARYHLSKIDKKADLMNLLHWDSVSVSSGDMNAHIFFMSELAIQFTKICFKRLCEIREISVRTDRSKEEVFHYFLGSLRRARS